MSVTNGALYVYGGNVAGGTTPMGAGPSTNIIEISGGGTLRIGGSVPFCLGNSMKTDFNDGNGAGGYNELNVRDGGKLIFDAGSAVAMRLRHVGTAPGSRFNVFSGGFVNFNERAYFNLTPGTNIYTQTGGWVTNVIWSVQDGSDTVPSLLDISGGTMHIKNMPFGTASGRLTGRQHVRIHGAKPEIISEVLNIYSKFSATSIPFFFDWKLGADTPRGGRGIAPFMMHNGNGSQYVQGYNRLSPEGGLQLVHTNRFDLIVKTEHPYGLSYGTWYAGVIGEEMWMTNF